MGSYTDPATFAANDEAEVLISIKWAIWLLGGGYLKYSVVSCVL